MMEKICKNCQKSPFFVKIWNSESSEQSFISELDIPFGVFSKYMIKWHTKNRTVCYHLIHFCLEENISKTSTEVHNDIWHETNCPLYSTNIQPLHFCDRCQRGQTEAWDWQILHLTNIKGSRSSSELCSLSHPKDKVWWMRFSEILRGRSVSEDSGSSDPKPCPFRRNESTACFSIQ